MEEIGWRLFVERIVSGLAWPVAVVIVAMVFRREVENLLKRLRAFKISGAELGFSELLDEVSREAATLAAPSTPVSKITIDEQTIAKHPHFAVIEAWRSVESEVAQLLQLLAPDISRHQVNGFRSFQLLRKTEAVDPEILSLMEDLRRVRNAAVHDSEPEVTIGQAIEYISLASRVEEALRDARRRITGT
tara:strand:+ start:110 stop:679 length:570 start_codon:yes stop_codon:yes gene_type:complete